MDREARGGERPTYRKPYLVYIDQIPLSQGFKVPNFTLFNGEDPHASSVERIGKFSIQCIAIENNPMLKLRLFGNSLSGQASPGTPVYQLTLFKLGSKWKMFSL